MIEGSPQHNLYLNPAGRFQARARKIGPEWQRFPCFSAFHGIKALIAVKPEIEMNFSRSRPFAPYG